MYNFSVGLTFLGCVSITTYCPPLLFPPLLFPPVLLPPLLLPPLLFPPFVFTSLLGGSLKSNLRFEMVNYTWFIRSYNKANRDCSVIKSGGNLASILLFVPIFIELMEREIFWIDSLNFFDRSIRNDLLWVFRFLSLWISWAIIAFILSSSASKFLYTSAIKELMSMVDIDPVVIWVLTLSICEFKSYFSIWIFFSVSYYIFFIKSY